jgi:multidrug efflux pump subunit AcrB
VDSYRKKIKATFISRCNYPTHRRSNVPTRLRARSKTFSAKFRALSTPPASVGFSLLSLVQNTYSAFFFVTFKPWSERTKPEEQYTAIKANINKQLAGVTEGLAFAFPPPAIPGVGHFRRIPIHIGRSQPAKTSPFSRKI